MIKRRRGEMGGVHHSWIVNNGEIPDGRGRGRWVGVGANRIGEQEVHQKIQYNCSIQPQIKLVHGARPTPFLHRRQILM
jgi:hypothetical protein